VECDSSTLALYGVSQAGYWVARALAFGHRFAAAIADGGVVSVGRTWFGNLPPQLLALYRSGDKAAIEALVPGAALARFTQEEGASYHCQPMARELTEQRMFDWLDEQIYA
jgi:hypothetical protein